MLDEFASFVTHRVLPVHFRMLTLILSDHCLNLPKRNDQSANVMPHDHVMLYGAIINQAAHAKLTDLF